MRLARSLSALAVIVVISSVNPSIAQPADPVAPYRAQREAVVEGFRIGGAIDAAMLAEAARGLEAVARSTSGETRARALMELGTVLRMNNDYQGAIAAQTEAARTAEALGLPDLAFDAWIGVARANELGPADHGAAALAFDRAVDAAGEQPTEKQRATLAGYLAELEIERGELDAGVIDALLAVGLRTIRRSVSIPSSISRTVWKSSCRAATIGRWSTPNRAATATTSMARAAAPLKSRKPPINGRTTPPRRSAGPISSMRCAASRTVSRIRSRLIDMRASTERLSLGKVFHPRSIRDVLVSKDFQAGASALADTPALASLIESVLAESEARTGRKNARSAFMVGLAKDVRRAPPEAAAQYYAEAARMLGAERGGFFDLRRRGTVIEKS